MSIAETLPGAPRRATGPVLRRLIGAIFVIWATATITFGVQALLPGDRAELIINAASGNFTQPSEAELAAVRAEYGFDKPFWHQYLAYIGGALRGDLGVSYQAHRPVTELIGEQIGPTLVLTLASLALAWVIAIAVTVASGGREGPVARALGGFQVIKAVAPPYWIGTILLVLISIRLGWLPVESGTGLAGLILPSLALAIPLSGFIGQIIRSEFARVLEQPFVTSARMRGMGDLAVRLRHVLRHAVLPGVTLSGWAIGSLFSGAAVIETVFARPGIGGLLVTGTSSRDIPLVTGIIIASAAIYVIANLIVDLVYPIIDPRLKTS